MNEFKEDKKRLDWLRKQEEKKTLVDWDDPQDVALRRSELRRAERVKILDKLVPERRCPICQQLKFGKSWVINKRKTKAICRSCFFIQAGEKPEKILEISPRYKLDGYRLAQARQSAGVSQNGFAKQAGWSRGYQSALESGYQETISLEVADTILQVLSLLGVDTKDCI